MKYILPLLLLSFFSTLLGQNLSNYQYILVPAKFKKFETNQYKLNTLLIAKLQSKKYIVIDENMQNWPLDLQVNSCNYVKADVLDTGNMFTNKIMVQFLDCHDQIVTKFNGKSDIKDLEEGLRDALNDALIMLPTSRPVAQNSTKLGVTSTTTTQDSEFEGYMNGNITYNKMLFPNGKFVFSANVNMAPFAIFTPSSKKGIYHVQLQDGRLTLGYDDSNNIIIEFPNADGSFSVQTFSKK